MIIKTGILFVGILFEIISLIVLNFIILEILYNFIINKKNKKKKIAIIIISALIIAGIGIGLILIGGMNIDYNENANYEKEELSDIVVGDKLDTWFTSFQISYDHIEFIETDSDKIKIVFEHAKDSKAYLNLVDEDMVSLGYQYIPRNPIEKIRDFINDLNEKKIKNYDNPKIYIYGSKENLEKIR